MISFCCFLIYFIVSMSLDYLFGNEFSLKNSLASSAVFALLWAFISGYKIQREDITLNVSPTKNATNPQNFDILGILRVFQACTLATTLKTNNLFTNLIFVYEKTLVALRPLGRADIVAYPICIWRLTLCSSLFILGSSTVSTPSATDAAILLRSTSSGRMSVCSNFE